MEAQGAAPPISRDHPLHHELTQENFSAAVVASAAMPGVFDPVPIKRHETGDINLYVDGGVANNTPIGMAVDAGANDITVVFADALDEVPAQLPRIFWLATTTGQALMRRRERTLPTSKSEIGSP